MDTYNINDKIENKLETEIIKLFGVERVVYKRYYHFLCKIDANKPPVEVSHDLFHKIPAKQYYMNDIGEIFYKHDEIHTEKIIGYGTFRGGTNFAGWNKKGKEISEGREWDWIKGTLKYLSPNKTWIYDASENRIYPNPDYLNSEELKAIAEKSKEAGEKKKAEIREKIASYVKEHKTTNIQVISTALNLPVATVRSHLTDMGLIEPLKCEYLRQLELRTEKEAGRSIKVRTTKKNTFIKWIISILTKIIERLI